MGCGRGRVRRKSRTRTAAVPPGRGPVPPPGETSAGTATMPHVVIVGGGLSGLSVAFRLTQTAPTVSCTVLEARDRPGGNVGTEDHRGFRVETGPNGFLDRTPFVLDLCRDLGLADRLVAASEGARKNRYVFLRG